MANSLDEVLESAETAADVVLKLSLKMMDLFERMANIERGWTQNTNTTSSFVEKSNQILKDLNERLSVLELRVARLEPLDGLAAGMNNHNVRNNLS